MGRSRSGPTVPPRADPHEGMTALDRLPDHIEIADPGPTFDRLNGDAVQGIYQVREPRGGIIDHVGRPDRYAVLRHESLELGDRPVEQEDLAFQRRAQAPRRVEQRLER